MEGQWVDTVLPRLRGVDVKRLSGGATTVAAQAQAAAGTPAGARCGIARLCSTVHTYAAGLSCDSKSVCTSVYSFCTSAYLSSATDYDLA